MTVSAWMRAARPVEGGLLIPGRPPRGGCDLVVAPDGVRVRDGALETHLPWETYAASGDDAWLLTQWTWGHSGPIGVAVEGAGAYATPTRQLRKRRRTLASLIDRIGDRSNVAPLYAAHTINTRVDADRDALAVLCQTLARRPAWRPQLGDSANVTQLLRDLAARDHGAVQPRTGIRRQAMESFIVMQQVGYQHPLAGRPLPDEPRPDDEEVVQAVLHHLVANRHALPADEYYVRAFVHRHYLDIGPWPFESLLHENPPRR